MRQLIRWTARLYPAVWRDRYGEELDALVEDIQPQWEDLFNVMLGALRMQMTTWNYVKIVTAVALAGALVAGVLAVETPSRYVSTAVVRFAPGGQADSDRQGALDRLVELQQEVLSRTSLAEIITQPSLNLYPKDRKKMPLEDVVENMRNKALRFQLMETQGGGVPAFMISCEYPDKYRAQAVARELLTRFLKQSIAIHGKQGPSAVGNLVILDPPNLPQRPLGPNRPMIVAMGLLGGAVLGLLAVLVWRGVARLFHLGVA